jgi:uncharacterized protein with HEPN domain
MNARQHQLRLADYIDHMLDASRTARSYVERIDKDEFPQHQNDPASGHS